VAQHAHNLLQQKRLACPAGASEKDVAPLAAQIDHVPLLGVQVTVQPRALGVGSVHFFLTFEWFCGSKKK
jgi:hypothetical protein